MIKRKEPAKRLTPVVQRIKAWSFGDCILLKNITIPKTTSMVASCAFGGCANLTINCEIDKKPPYWNKDWNPDNRPVIWGCDAKN